MQEEDLGDVIPNRRFPRIVRRASDPSRRRFERVPPWKAEMLREIAQAERRLETEAAIARLEAFLAEEDRIEKE